jgi:pyrimidine deaminase RibD-like protein
VQYSPPLPGPLANVDWCALAIMVDDRPVETVQTIGTGYTESVGCTDLDGIAFPDLDGDGRFEIALIYSTLAPPDRYGKTPVVVRRSKDGTFAVDAALGEALDQQGGITTLRALRQAATARLKEKD